MGYLDDLRQYERDHPGEAKEFAKKYGPPKKPQNPDRLADYRDQRLNRPDGPGSYEPEIT